MRKFYEKKGILFAVAWILVYCLAMAPLKEKYGYGSVWMLLALAAIAAAITAFVRANRLEKRCGLDAWPKDAKRYWYFLPIFVLATGNLWDGFALSHEGTAQVFAVLSMLLVGYVEEMIFRGFLFRAMLEKDKPATAIVVSALTFGIGHIINLFAGQTSPETVAQVVFAVAWGFLLTMVFYKSGSLLPCIIAHALVDVCSMFGADTEAGDWAYIIATVVVAIVYCLYLSRLKTEKSA